MSFPPWPADQVARYTAYRASGPIAVDGHLDEPSWHTAPKSPRFRDMIHGGPTIHDTRAAVLWDAQNLYVGFWIEEPCVEATLLNRDDPIYTNNDVECFIAGKDSYYEFEINAHGTVYEALFIWEEAYARDGYDKRARPSPRRARRAIFQRRRSQKPPARQTHRLFSMGFPRHAERSPYRRHPQRPCR